MNTKETVIVLVAFIIVATVFSYCMLTTVPSFTASVNEYEQICFEWDFHDRNDSSGAVYILFEKINGTYKRIGEFPYDQHKFFIGGESKGNHTYTMARFNNRAESLDPKNFTTKKVGNHMDHMPSSPAISPTPPSPRPCERYGEYTVEAYNLDNSTQKMTVSVNL